MACADALPPAVKNMAAAQRAAQRTVNLIVTSLVAAIPDLGHQLPPNTGLCFFTNASRQALQKKASVRISILSRGRPLGGGIGSWKAVWAVHRARPSRSES